MDVMGAGLDAHQYSDTTQTQDHQAMVAPMTLPAPQELFNVEEALLATPTAPPRAVMVSRRAPLKRPAALKPLRVSRDSDGDPDFRQVACPLLGYCLLPRWWGA